MHILMLTSHIVIPVRRSAYPLIPWRQIRASNTELRRLPLPAVIIYNGVFPCGENREMRTGKLASTAVGLERGPIAGGRETSFSKSRNRFFFRWDCRFWPVLITRCKECWQNAWNVITVWPAISWHRMKFQGCSLLNNHEQFLSQFVRCHGHISTTT